MRKPFILIMCLLLLLSISFQTNFKAEATNNNKLGSHLQEQLQEVTNELEIIVGFHSSTQDERKHLLEDLEITQAIVFNELPLAGALASKEQILQLNEESIVRSVYFNSAIEYENAEATALTGVDDVRTDSELQKHNNGMPITGDGIGVVINDSGVDGTHEDLKFGSNLVQNVLGATNLNAVSEVLPITYVEDVQATDNNSGHGTHVAGTVGATGAKSGGKHEGVAPGANLVGYGSGAGVAILDTLGAFEYALVNQQKYNIRVITNSWGATSDSGTPFDPNHPINIATKKLFDRGILTVFSAGNSGPEQDTISGNYKKAPWVVSVAAGTKDGELTNFSSRGSEGVKEQVEVDGETWEWIDQPTVTAPGYKIISTRVLSPLPLLATTDDLELIEPAYLPYYTTMSGTSMSAPHVAGIAALLFETDPTLSPLDVKNILMETATPMEGYEPYEVGAGYVNAYLAVKKASK
ncbi:subtilisin family serine protease [Alkalibacillus filiformis]|uniref:Subtilisin family serine protease n=1 Tax=Alkalibacillus filiformis TaxID=200990 RepID=A0ABU0DST2_9BACI|nr:S8 family serine peptidase [Alkalibacillus filiformis]MDQ0351494.1 subtilisin family serine protease [Alkalibacillus filiformis]